MKTLKSLLALGAITTFNACGKEKVSAIGDTVVIDFTGSINGIKFEGGTADDFSLKLGSGSFIGDFEQQLVGYKAGEWVEVKVQFPEDYHAKHLAGHWALFETKIEKVIKK